MALTISELSRVAREFISSFDNIKANTDSIAQIEADRVVLLQKYNDYKLFYDKFNTITTSYETERRWLDGTTYTPILQSQIDDSAQRVSGNVHFPPTWEKLSPKITDNMNGNPTTTSSNDESTSLNASLDNQGITQTISFLQNGQSSGVASHILAQDYIPGNTTIELTSGTQTSGNLLLVSGSGTSTLVRVTGVAGTTISISEVIAPATTITSGGTVVENISGFTNTERNTLTSSSYQRVLTTLTNRVITKVSLWDTALSNQLTQLNNNLDTASGIATAKTNVQAARSAISAWSALPNIGSGGTDSKFTNNNLSSLATAYNNRISQGPTRATQISTALGSATQDSGDGTISGTGPYMQRFKSLSLMINSADGPYYQYFLKLKIIDVSKQMTQNELGKLEIFGTAVKLFKLKSNAVGTNIVELQSSAGLSVGNQVVVICTGQPDMVANVTHISGVTVTLDKAIPTTYTVTQKASIAKAL